MSVTKLRDKGQITIPASIRKALRLNKDCLVSINKIGDVILLAPRPSVFDNVANEFSQQSKKQGITLDELLSNLKKLRKQKS